MKFLKNKTLAIATTVLFIFSMIASMMSIPTAHAHTPSWQIPTYAYINVAPDKVGVGQQCFVIMWLDKLYENAYLYTPYRFHNYKLVITAPDGTNTTQTFAVISDSTSAQTYAFTPNTVGTYTVTFVFPGQTVTADNAAADDPYLGDTYAASSASTTLTVQSSPVPAASQGAPLPTAYWTRPIYGENTYWYPISSNWLGSTWPGYAAWGTFTANQQSFPDDAVGSLTSHIMWTKPIQSGGVVGGNNYPTLPGNTWFEGSAYSQRYMNPLIVDGMLIYNPPIAWNGVPTAFTPNPYGPTTCVDLQTGKVLWTNPNMPAPSFAYIYDAEDPNQHGVWPPVLISSTVTSGLFGSFPGNWYAYDAFTGSSLFNVTNVPAGAVMMGPSGEYLSLSFVNYGTPTSPKIYMQQWNSSRLWDDQYSGPSTVPNLTPPITDGSNPALLDFNISMPTLTSIPTIDDAFYGDELIVNTGSFPGAGTFVAPPTGFPSAPYTYYGINIAQGSIGQILWSNTLQAPAGNLTVSPGSADPTANGGHGVFVEAYKETMQWVGYDMSTGQKLWGPTASMAPLDYYGNPAVPIIGGVAAYGKLYSTGYAGILYCWDLTTGNLLWTWGNGGTGNSSYAGFNFPFGVYPMQINAIGNDVVYMVTTEHTIETPLNKGAFAVAVNATTGQQIWSLSGYTGEFFGPSYAMADGYNTWFNGYDNSIYVIGRGPSATIVSTGPKVTTVGGNVIIEGTVMDVATGTQGTQQKGEFPYGVPCSSDASMADWMGYVYQQQAIPTNFTGVTVKLSVLDSNGNHYPIGTAITDASGMYTLTYTPTIAGNFTVYATFAGTQGYWPSSAESSFYAGSAAATPTPTSTPLSLVGTQNSIIFGVATIIIIIVIIGAVLAILVQRKHP
jgi:hypothetical protein